MLVGAEEGVSLPAVLPPVPRRWEQRSPFPADPVWWDRADPLQTGDFCLKEGTQQLLAPFSLTGFEIYEENKNISSGWPALLWRGMLCVGGAALGGAALEQPQAVMERGHWEICDLSPEQREPTGTPVWAWDMEQWDMCSVGPRCFCRVD